MRGSRPAVGITWARPSRHLQQGGVRTGRGRRPDRPASGRASTWIDRFFNIPAYVCAGDAVHGPSAAASDERAEHRRYPYPGRRAHPGRTAAFRSPVASTSGPDRHGRRLSMTAAPSPTSSVRADRRLHVQRPSGRHVPQPRREHRRRPAALSSRGGGRSRRRRQVIGPEPLRLHGHGHGGAFEKRSTPVERASSAPLQDRRRFRIGPHRRRSDPRLWTRTAFSSARLDARDRGERNRDGDGSSTTSDAPGT